MLTIYPFEPSGTCDFDISSIFTGKLNYWIIGGKGIQKTENCTFQIIDWRRVGAHTWHERRSPANQNPKSQSRLVWIRFLAGCNVADHVTNGKWTNEHHETSIAFVASTLIEGMLKNMLLLPPFSCSIFFFLHQTPLLFRKGWRPALVGLHNVHSFRLGVGIHLNESGQFFRLLLANIIYRKVFLIVSHINL